MHDRVVAKRKEHLSDRRDEHLVISARQIGPPDRACEQRVADKELPASLSRLPDLEADASRTVTWRMVPADLVSPEGYRLTWSIEHVDGGLRLDLQAEHLARLNSAFVEEQVVVMQIDRHAEGALCLGDARYVIYVRVRQKNVSNGQPITLGNVEKAADLIAGIDHDRFARVLARNDESVLEEGSNRAALNYHWVLR
jgi:hypothetical protein